MWYFIYFLFNDWIILQPDLPFNEFLNNVWIFISSVDSRFDRFDREWGVTRARLWEFSGRKPKIAPDNAFQTKAEMGAWKKWLTLLKIHWDPYFYLSSTILFGKFIILICTSLLWNLKGGKSKTLGTEWKIIQFHAGNKRSITIIQIINCLVNIKKRKGNKQTHIMNE